MRTQLFVSSVFALVCGCSPAGDEAPVVDDTQAFRAELEGGREFLLEPGAANCVVKLRSRGQWVGEGEMTTELAILSGRVELAPGEGDALRVVDLALSLEDVVVSKEIYPPGARLGDVSLALAEEAVAPASWSASEAHAAGALDAELSWSLHLGDSSSPLATQRIRDLPYDVVVQSIEGEDGEVSFQLSIVDEGSIWKLDEYLEVVAVDIELAGVSAR